MHTHEPIAPVCPFSRRAAEAPSLADTLKLQTRDAHTRAEKHPLQGRMVKGEVTHDEYAAYLGQLLHFWRAVDAGLATLAARDARVHAMLRPYHPHADRIAADLAFLGQCASCHPPLAATTNFVDTINAAATNGPALVGIWYVLEGSANGGRYIARAISRCLNIPGPEGLTAFDPHGEAQRERWQTWRSDLDAQPFTPCEREAILTQADATFDAMCEMMDELTSAKAL